MRGRACRGRFRIRPPERVHRMSCRRSASVYGARTRRTGCELRVRGGGQDRGMLVRLLYLGAVEPIVRGQLHVMTRLRMGGGSRTPRDLLLIEAVWAEFLSWIVTTRACSVAALDG